MTNTPKMDTVLSFSFVNLSQYGINTSENQCTIGSSQDNWENEYKNGEESFAESVSLFPRES